MSPALSEEFPVVVVVVVFEPEQPALVEPAVRDVSIQFGRFFHCFLSLSFGLFQRLMLQVQLGATARRDLVFHHRGDDIIQDVGHAAATLDNLW